MSDAARRLLDAIAEMQATRDADPEAWAQRIAEQQAARTDPWRWYCRICGATGEAPKPGERNATAAAHGTPVDESGRLLHIRCC